MSTQSYRQITHNGLWKNNPALVQLLGLCPLLAVTASVVNATGLAAATLFVLVTSNTAGRPAGLPTGLPAGGPRGGRPAGQPASPPGDQPAGWLACLHAPPAGTPRGGFFQRGVLENRP